MRSVEGISAVHGGEEVKAAVLKTAESLSRLQGFESPFFLCNPWGLHLGYIKVIV